MARDSPLTSHGTSPVSSAVSCLQADALQADISSTISVTASRPSGRKASNLESLNRIGLKRICLPFRQDSQHVCKNYQKLF